MLSQYQHLQRSEQLQHVIISNLQSYGINGLGIFHLTSLNCSNLSTSLLAYLTSMSPQSQRVNHVSKGSNIVLHIHKASQYIHGRYSWCTQMYVVPWRLDPSATICISSPSLTHILGLRACTSYQISLAHSTNFNSG